MSELSAMCWLWQEREQAALDAVEEEKRASKEALAKVTSLAQCQNCIELGYGRGWD